MQAKMKKLALSIVAVGIASMAQPATAQWYGGVSVGSSDTKLDQSVLTVPAATANSFTKDDTDTGYKIQAGYTINPNFAIEGGYVNLGKFSLTNNVTAPVVGSLKGSGKADGWNLVAVGSLPIGNDFSLIGKLGTIYSTTKVDLATSGAVVLVAGTPINREKNEWNWTYGLGLQYALSKTISLRGEWERFDKLGTNSGINATGEYNFNMYSVGLNFKF